MEIEKSMLYVLNLDKLFWTEAVINAVYIQKIYLVRALDSITSEEV